MRKFGHGVAWIVCARVLSGCGSTAPRVSEEPVTFAHQDEWAIKGGFAALADRRIFTTMAFLNAAGHDEEIADPKWTALCEDQVAFDTKAGLVLTQPFYRLLKSYEESGKAFDEYLPLLLEKLPAP